MAITSQIVGLDPDDFGYSVSVKKIEVMDGEKTTYQRVTEIDWYVVGVDADGNRVKQYRKTFRLKDTEAKAKQGGYDLLDLIWQLGKDWVGEQQATPKYDD